MSVSASQVTCPHCGSAARIRPHCEGTMCRWLRCFMCFSAITFRGRQMIHFRARDDKASHGATELVCHV